jgi:hypothetical protein
MIVDNLIDILEQFDYPVDRQGSYAGKDYPDTFITFWNSDSTDHAHYDNHEYGTSWIYNVYVYSVDPEITFTLLEQIRTELKNNNWIVPGKGFDVTTEEPSHTGRGITIYYLEIESE